MPDDKKEPISTSSPDSDWREIAEKASKEQDPQKLTQLVLDLCEKLDRNVIEKKRPRDESH